MRVLTLYNRVPWPRRDGGVIAVMLMHELLRDHDYINEMMCLNPSRNYVDEELIPDELYKELSLSICPINTDLTMIGGFLNLLSSAPYNTSRFFSRTFEEQLILRLRNRKYNLIVLEAPFMGVYLPVIRRYSKAKVILRAHNIDHLIWVRMAANCRNPIKKLYLKLQSERFKRYETELVQSVDAVVPISRVDARWFEQFKPYQAVCVSVPAVKLPTMPVMPVHKITTLGFIGTLDWRPNVEGIQWFLQHCWPAIHQAHPELTFRLAGRNMPPELAKLELPGLEIVGEVTDANYFLRGLQLFVAPLFTGSGIRIKLIEALAVGLPAVTTPIGAEGLPVEHGRELMLAKTAEGFVQAVSQMVKDPHKASMIGDRGRVFVSEYFNREKTGRELDRFYRFLVYG